MSRAARSARQIGRVAAVLTVAAAGVGGASARTGQYAASTELVYASARGDQGARAFVRVDPVTLEILASFPVAATRYVLSPDHGKLALVTGSALRILDASTLEELGAVDLPRSDVEYWHWAKADRIVGFRSRGAVACYCFGQLDAVVVDPIRLTSAVVRAFDGPKDAESWAATVTRNGISFLHDLGWGTRFRFMSLGANGAVRTRPLQVASGSEDARVHTVPPGLAKALAAVRRYWGKTVRIRSARAGWWEGEDGCNGPVPPWTIDVNDLGDLIAPTIPGYRILFSHEGGGQDDVLFDLETGVVLGCSKQSQTGGFNLLHRRLARWTATTEALVRDPTSNRVYVVTPRLLVTIDLGRGTVRYERLRGSIGGSAVTLVARWAGNATIAVQTTPPVRRGLTRSSVVSILDVRTARARPIDSDADAWFSQMAVSSGRILVPGASGGLNTYDNLGRLRYRALAGARVMTIRVVGKRAYVQLGFGAGPIYVLDVPTGQVVNEIRPSGTLRILAGPD
jgi:hypothetical protein